MLTKSRPIGEHLEFMEVLGELTNTSPDVTLDDFEEWQSRPLDAVYPVLFIDSLPVKTRESGRPVFTVIGLDVDGYRDVLGLWWGWDELLKELKSRGVNDVCVLVCDDEGGLPEAARTAWPQAVVQLNVTRVVRACQRYATKKDQTSMAQSLRAIFTAEEAAQAEVAVEDFAQRWQARYPAAVRLWRAHWAQISALWNLPPQVRRIAYTTSHLESVNAALRKVVRAHGHFPTSGAALSALHLALRAPSEKDSVPCPRWKQALQAFTIHFDGRLPLPS